MARDSDAESDVDMNDMTKMVGDLKNLESDLFASTRNPKTGETRNRVKDTTKKVAFEDSDDDLDDLLSEGKDSVQNTKFLSSDVKSSKVAALFRIGTSESKGVPINASTLPESMGSLKPVQKDLPLEKRSLVEKTSGNDPQKALEPFETSRNEISTIKVPDRVKKSLFMEDLIGLKPRASSLKDVSKSPPKRITETPEKSSESMPNLVGKDQLEKSGSSGFTLTASSSREPRRGRGKSTALNDPLGFWASSALQEPQIPDKKSEVLERKSQNSEPPDDLPEWLGGTRKTDKSEVKAQDLPAAVKIPQQGLIAQSEIKTLPHPEVSQLIEVQLEQQAALITLQQQEHELRAATVLSQQSEHLHSVISRQQNQLNEQEKMFNILVKKQVDRQAALDMEIKMQQAKIDHYIQALAKSPVDSLPTFQSEYQEFGVTEKNKLRGDAAMESDGLINKLEIDKQNVENIVMVLKEKHEREIKILEDSHETQMHFMRSSMERLETKLREDTETLEKYYENKIEKIGDEKNQMEELLREQIRDLKEEQKEIINEMHARHKDQIALLQKEHSETIENISRAKQLERQAVDFMESNRTNLEKILNNSKEIFDNFQNISDQVSSKETDLITKKERDLINQEEQLRGDQQINKLVDVKFIRLLILS
uniref:Fbf1_1 protein n=1 Tax=Fopius arisanus TaxID=64838 RepID=A0A0C9R420_9HYME